MILANEPVLNPINKKKANQLLLHKVKNAFGVIEVKESESIRSLYFGSDSKQSSMYLYDSNALVLKYTQSIALSILLKENLNSVLLLGLGGGSLVKFIHHHFPSCHIEVVEQSKEVKNIAYEFFELPRHQNIQIHLDDAGDFIRSPKSRKYDLIVADAYHADGMSCSVQGVGFFNACFTHLNASGIFCTNLWLRHSKASNNLWQALNACFSNPILKLPVEDKANLILFGIKGPFFLSNRKELICRAKKFGKQTGVDFLHLFRKLIQHNPALFRFILFGSYLSLFQ